MQLKNVLIVVNDIERSKKFYKDIFGLEVILDNEGNVILEDSLRVLYARNAENVLFRDFSYEIAEDMKGEVEDPVFIENCENVEY